MDVDINEQYLDEPLVQSDSAAKSTGKKPITVVVDDAHPFDLDAYISSYSGRTAIYRLLHIMQHCPTLAGQAFQLAIDHIRRSRDPTFYQKAVNLYDTLPGITDPASPVDQRWAEQVQVKNHSERNKLEVELKTYQSNMIKESIRMAHRDLGDFYRVVGDYAASLKHYTKSREFCTTSQHILDMCISVLELLIDQKSYAHITTYVFKADAALDVATASGNNGTASGSNASASAAQLHKKAPPSAEREKVQTKLDFASGLSHLGQASYDKAALAFLRLGAPKGLGDWIGKLVTSSDIAIYGVLCALATLSRGAIKVHILENEVFGIYLEQEPYVRELVEAYMSSKFKTVLELLDRFSSRHFLDIHLFPHIHDLTTLIRNRALVLYFRPFASIKLQRMGQAFGMSVEEMEKLVVSLIQAGEIKGRIDSQNKVLKARQFDQRAALFARAVQVGAEIQSANRKLLLRMRLQQADLIVKAPKGHHASSAHPIENFMAIS